MDRVSNDYRISFFDSQFTYSTEILQRKRTFSQNMNEKAKSDATKGQHYQNISKKKGNSYKEFKKIYGNRCAYCGVTITINSNTDFEIDHFKAKAIEGENDVMNLIFACKKCNQAKKKFDISKFSPSFTPDTDRFATIFSRDEHYKIIINEEFAENEKVRMFYTKLNLGSSFRKLDYLLVNLEYFEKMNGGELKEPLNKIFGKLQKYRNRTFS